MAAIYYMVLSLLCKTCFDTNWIDYLPKSPLMVPAIAAQNVIFFMLIKEVGPAKATLITYVNTAVALSLGIIFLGEQITIGLVVGIPLITIGLILAGGRESEPELSKAG